MLQAFARAYTAPENVELRKAERRASMQRLLSGDGGIEDLGARQQPLPGGGSRLDDGISVASSAPVILNSMTVDEIKAWIIEERQRNPYLSVTDVLAAIENSPASRSHRAAYREQVANARRRGASNPTEDPVAKRDDALAELDAAAAQLRKADPNLSEAQAFARIYKSNPALAKAERSAAREALFA